MSSAPRAAVVDDDDQVRATVRAALVERGYAVVEARSAEEALALDPTTIDVMVLDLHLPDLTGATVWQRLRGKGSTAPFPILFFSAETDPRVIAACLTWQTDHIGMPINSSELQARVDVLVRRRQGAGDDAAVLQRSAMYDVLRDETAQTLLQHHVSGLRVIGSGLAHEMNSPLAALLASLQFSQSAADDDVDKPAALDDALLAAQRLAALVRRAQQMGTSTNAPAPVPLRALIEEIAAAFSPVAATIEIVGDEHELVAVKSELWALFNALLENAVEACSDKAGAGRVVVTLAARAHVVDIVIDDNGRGIDEKDLPFVFDLFFTKKHRWSSVGLGLPIAQAAAHRQGGFVFVDGKGPLGGARVSVLLPQRQSTADAHPARRAIRRGLWSGDD